MKDELPPPINVKVDGDNHGSLNVAGGDIHHYEQITINHVPQPSTPSSHQWQRVGLFIGVLASIVAIVIFVFFPQIIGATNQIKPAAQAETLIIVSDFIGSNGETASARIYRVLKERVEENELEDVRVERLDNVAPESSEDAISIGNDYQATIVIWGTADDTAIEPFYEVITHDTEIETRLTIEAANATMPTFAAYVAQDVPEQFEYLMLFSLGQISYFQQNYTQAITFFDHAKELNVGTTQNLGQDALYFYRGFANRQLGNMKAAEQDYTIALSYNPNFMHAYINRGASFYYQGLYDEAIHDYDQALVLNPENSATYHNRGLAYLALRDYQNALSDFDKVIEYDEDFVSAYLNRGTIYIELGQLDNALNDFNRVVELNPSSHLIALAYNNQAYALALYSSDYEHAIELVEKAIGLEPSLATAFHTRGFVYLQQGALERALNEFSLALELDNSVPEVYRDRGRIHQLQGNSAKALADINYALQLNPYDARCYYYRAEVYLSLNQRDLALQDYKEFLELYQLDDELLSNAQAKILELGGQ